jgi:hypothetical protein
MAWIGLIDPDTLVVEPVARCGHEEGYLDKIAISLSDHLPERRGATGQSLRTGKFFICKFPMRGRMHSRPFFHAGRKEDVLPLMSNRNTLLKDTELNLWIARDSVRMVRI